MYLVILAKQFLTQLFQDTLFNDGKSSLSQEKGCSFAIACRLCCSLKVQVHLGVWLVVMLHASALNCGRLISNHVWFCARSPESEHPPQCVIKSDVHVYKGLSDKSC